MLLGLKSAGQNLNGGQGSEHGAPFSICLRLEAELKSLGGM